MTYAIAALGTNRIKIGKANNIRERMFDLQSACPVELRLIASSEDDVEARLHVMLKEYRLHGEWFIDNDAVRAVVLDLLSPSDMSIVAELGKGKTGKQSRCKRCGGLGHYAKTCSQVVDVGNKTTSFCDDGRHSQ